MRVVALWLRQHRPCNDQFISHLAGQSISLGPCRSKQPDRLPTGPRVHALARRVVASRALPRTHRPLLRHLALRTESSGISDCHQASAYPEALAEYLALTERVLMDDRAGKDFDEQHAEGDDLDAVIFWLKRRAGR